MELWSTGVGKGLAARVKYRHRGIDDPEFLQSFFLSFSFSLSFFSFHSCILFCTYQEFFLPLCYFFISSSVSRPSYQRNDEAFLFCTFTFFFFFFVNGWWISFFAICILHWRTVAFI